MLTTENRVIAEELKSRLIGAGIHPVKCILFGSRARGDFEEHSDMDLLIVLKVVPPETKFLINGIAHDLGFDEDILILPIVLSEAEYQSSLYRALPIFEAIQEEGVAL